MKVYIGWDGRDALAYEVCVASLIKHATIPLDIIPLKDWELRQKGVFWRPYHVDEKGQAWDGMDGKPCSTQFSFTRFCVPALEDYADEQAIFMDPDMMVRSDISEVMKLAKDKALYCVQHDHRPKEKDKMGGLLQTVYQRKNWSSFMVMNPSKCLNLTPYVVNNQPGSYLHAMCWLQDDEIGNLPVEWNWLCGWSDPKLEPKIVHYTRGSPDMPGYEQEPYADEWRQYQASIGGFFNGAQVAL